MRAIYVADTEGAVSIAANTTLVPFGVKGDSGHAIDLLGLAFSIDQATPTATDKGVFVELCSCTFATNSPGSGGSTAVTVDTEAGPRITETFAAGKNWASGTPPTVLVALRPFDCDPYKFTYERDYPLGESLDFAVAEGFVLRVTNPTGNQSINFRAWARWARA